MSTAIPAERRQALNTGRVPATHLAECLAVDFAALLQVVAPDARHVRLPVCTDRDDQKFLEIARDAGAEVLVTKDKALLKLGRRTAREGLFKIMQPEAWLKARQASTLE